MIERLRRPLWPGSRLGLTTPLDLLKVAACVVAGVLLYRRGYTYEGSVLVYMVGGIVFAWPYYAARYTRWMTSLVFASIVPATIWLQNKAVEVGLWGYPGEKAYWLGWFTRVGEGPLRWSRHLWLGNDMPVMEYLFYPAFCLFQVVLYALYSHVLPDRYFEEEHPRLRPLFPWILGPVTAAWLLAYVRFPNPRATDYAWWMMGCGFAITWAGWAWSPSFRAYARSPAFWLWMLLMAVGFLPVWEAFHIGINGDWRWNIENTFPAAYTFRGASLPFHEFFGYVTSATTFQALMFFLIRRFGAAVVKDRSLVPFSDV
ncbi:MAG: hypothetical protein HYU51_18345 [Candidatus Rokubacteria bacterium]|nr:hypothetical protein [Candidatus Rokubacteria bacterium]